MKPTARTTLQTLGCSISLLIAGPLGAQVGPPPMVATPPGVGVFGTFGLGVATGDIGGVIALSVHSSHNAFVLRASGVSEFTLFSPGDTAEDYALLFGRVRERERGWVRFAVGPALVRSWREGNAYDCAFIFCAYEVEKSRHVGLAFQADAVWSIVDVFGLGLTGFANINGGMSYGGVAAAVHLGRVRRS